MSLNPPIFVKSFNKHFFPSFIYVDSSENGMQMYQNRKVKFSLFALIQAWTKPNEPKKIRSNSEKKKFLKDQRDEHLLESLIHSSTHLQ
jgi:hypothetical protein